MQPKITLLALDIGNTRAHVGIIDTQRHTCLASTAFPVREAGQRLLSAIDELIGKTGAATGKTVAIASVVSEAGAALDSLLQQRGYSLCQLTAASPLPFAIRYDTPHTLGADRIANALYAATVYPGKPVICISAGTAIVIDYSAEATFYGGAILPGVRLQLSSLHSGTDGLPDLGSNAAMEIPVLPGTSTQRCIIGGVVRGAASAIGGIVAEYAHLAPDRQPIILATGGDWQLIGPLVDFDHTVIPDLTLIGTACLLNGI